YKVADTANSKNDNIYENVNSSQSFNNNMDKNNSKTIEKNRNPDVKTAPSISDWIDLKSAVSSAKGKEVTLTLKKGTYKNNGVIRWDNVDTKLTIDGNGQTIDGNKQLAFSIQKGSSLVLKNITIKNCEAGYGGAIVNYGKLTIIQSTFTNNSARTIYGAGAIFNNEILNITQSNFTDNAGANGGAIQNNKTGKTDITQSIFKNNHVINVIGAGFGGAIDNEGTMTITKSTLTNNSAKHGGAIYNGKSLTITDSTLANNTAEKGGAIKQLMGANAVGNINIARNTFINNHANNNKETVDLGGFDKGQTESNVYKSTDISIKRLNLNVKDNQTIFHTGEDVVINLDIGNLEHPNFYDKDILKKLEDITIYINGVENVTTKIKNYTLSNLKPGNYSVYYKTCNQKSNTITFIVTSVSNWQELQEAVRDAESQTEDTTIYLMKGNYTNTGTIEWINPNITLTIEGNGQTIDGNQLQAFNINSRSSMILKNITIINAKSKLGGAIQNNGNLTVTQSTLANNTAEDGGAIENTGTLTVIQSRLTGNTAKYDGGAINNKYDLNITESTLSDNMVSEYGGAIFNDQHLFSVVGSNFTNDNAKRGGAIFSIGNANLTGNTFINNTADNNETIDLYLQGRADADSNVYESTDIAFRKIALSIKDNQNSFTPYDDVVLNFTIGLRNPKYYDSDILERLEDITIYVNGVEYATTKYENYTLSDLKPGKYTLYYTTCNQKSNSVTFKVIGQSNITTPENSYDYIEGIPDTITLNINDSSSQKGTAIITVK
ncbi:MAG: hypothetical protein J6S29_02740, partial [Methanosphaera sp.]|nr:hypothetical protein [Methanosphaera sp.]